MINYKLFREFVNGITQHTTLTIKGQKQTKAQANERNETVERTSNELKNERIE